MPQTWKRNPPLLSVTRLEPNLHVTPFRVLECEGESVGAVNPSAEQTNVTLYSRGGATAAAVKE